MKSQEALYKTYYAYSMSICLRYAPDQDEAVDIMNDAFIKVFESIKNYDPKSSFISWLRRIIINTAIDNYRKSMLDRKYITYSDNETMAIDTNSVDSLELEDIMLILNKLPEQQRVVFNLYEIEGYSHKEIAEKFDISEETSRAYLSRAKQNIRKFYLKYNQEATTRLLVTA